jgi:tetratricopeptide (TPR) repeat protein
VPPIDFDDLLDAPRRYDGAVAVMPRFLRVLSVIALVAGAAVAASAGSLAEQGRTRLPPPAPDSGPGATPLEQNMDGRVARLERWLKVTVRHTPGVDDEALAEVAAWPNANLREIWIDTNVLVQIMRGRRSDRFAVRAEGRDTATQVRYTKAQLQRLNVLACAAGGALVETTCMAMRAADDLDPELRQLAALARASKLRGDDNYILRHGALLHGDVAVIAPISMAAPDSAPSSAGPERLRMDISDGRQVSLGQSPVHWEIARMLLDFVQPRGSDRAAPGRDDMVRQWYRATSAWMQLREDHERLHLQRARELFPADPDILFLSGCERETYAAPPIQTVVRSAVLPTGVTFDVLSDRGELRQAETFFRRTLEIRPDHAEARTRYGRVLGALGRHAEAAVELRRAVPELRETQLLYYAELFLGAEEEALGHHEAARAAYEQAAALAPNAQSPLLALSQLARHASNRPAALHAIERLFALPSDIRARHHDPWWSYYVFQARDADDLLKAMRQPFLSEPLP